ncbi:MAG TPA: roadblock/LC7 domain-containing protein [Gaiellaceae bacterium]|nr:roadblock/LC7 domain-containing protein [Gaiellaceae bacterium]
MDATQALGELMELSSQITAAVVLDGDGAALASSSDDSAALAAPTLELVAAAADLGGDGRDVTRVEVELDEGAMFVVREGEYTIAATTGPDPTSGLVVYDLRTCAQAITSGPRKRRARKPKEPSE